MQLTADQTSAAAAVRARLVAQGVDPARAAVIVSRATARAAERCSAGLSACCPSCQCGGSCLGQTVPVTLPAQLAPASVPVSAPAGAPAILATIDTAGNNPTVVAMQAAVSKWSWLIPVGGLLMSAKSKFTDWRASKTDPAYAASKSLRSR